MGRLMPLIGERLTADDSAVGARILGWEGDVSPAGQSVPLRTAGALHALVLDGTDPALAAAYPPAEVDDDTLWSAVDGAIRAMRHRILTALDRAPQTNEIRRSAILLPALWWLLGQSGRRPVDLSELGASAGLNLMLDRFAIETPGGGAGPADSPVHLRPEWRAAPPPARPLRVVDRAGVDRHPIDAGDPVDALRLMSYLWPDQPDRMAMTRGAIAMGPTRPDEGDAAPGWPDVWPTAGPGGSTWSTRPSPGNISPPKRSPPAPGHLRPRARMRRRTTRSPMSPSRPMAAATVARSLCGSGPMRRSPRPLRAPIFTAAGSIGSDSNCSSAGGC
jgi:hypothetical protein